MRDCLHYSGEPGSMRHSLAASVLGARRLALSHVFTNRKYASLGSCHADVRARMRRVITIICACEHN